MLGLVPRPHEALVIGTGFSNSYKRDFWEFDPVLNTWTQKADFGGTARQDAVGFSIGTKGYVGTGYDGSLRQKDIWEFDPASNIWTQKADFGGTARSNAVGFSIGTKGYLGTGNIGAKTKDFWEFDPNANTWTQKADFGGIAREGAVGFSIESFGYIGTGKDNSGNPLGDFWEYEPNTNNWTQKASMTGGIRTDAIGFAIGAQGLLGLGRNPSGLVKDFWEYIPSTNVWIRKTDFVGTARENAIGFSIGAKGYVGTGYDGNYKKDFWEYLPSGFRVGLLSSNSFCEGTTISIPFFLTTPCNSGNIFTAELSDSLGGFNTPLAIGTLTGTSSAIISGTIPVGTGNGKKFRIRVISSDPANISIDNLINISIHNSIPGDLGQILGPANGCKLNNNTYSVNPSILIDRYAWTIPSGVIGNGSLSNSIVLNYGSSFSGGVLSVKGQNACGDGPIASILLGVNDCGNTWTQLTDFNGSYRSGSIGFSIGIKGYVGTGQNQQGNYMKDLWEFDPVTNSWTQKANLIGVPRAGAVSFSIGTKGYVGTGEISFYDNARDFWEFDPIANTWTQKADFGGTARRNAVGFSIEQKGYVGTGNEGMYYNNIPKKDFWEFDPINNSWSQKSDFPGTARYAAVGFSIENQGYIGLGSAGKDFWEFDPTSNSWLQKASFNGVSTSGAVGFCIGDKGYVGLGSVSNDFWEYDPISDSWIQKATFSGVLRNYAVGFSIGNRGYYGTGTYLNRYKDFWEYKPDGFRAGLITSTSFCAGSSIEIPFTVSSQFNPGNIFYAQLSDSIGFFSTPVFLGSISGVISDTIIGYIPSDIPIGKKYRIRIVSSDPVMNSVDNNIDLAIFNNVPDAPGPISGPTSACMHQDQVYNVVSSYNTEFYEWVFPSGISSNESKANTIVLKLNESINSGILEVRGKNACGVSNASILTLNTINCGNYWIRQNNFGGGARDRAVSFSINSKGYFGTGYSQGVYKMDFWEFNPIDNSWTQKADFKGDARMESVAFSIGTKGYIGTGYSEYGYRRDFWEFDPDANTWVQKTDFGGVARSGAVGFSIGDKGYIGTGSGTGGGYLKDFWQYDPISNFWTQKADFSGVARKWAVGFSIDMKGFIGMGYNDTRLKDFWEYNPITNTWSQKADFGGTSRSSAVGFSINRKGYIGTGQELSRLKDFWEYNPDENIWTQKMDFSGTARSMASGFSIGSRGYLGCGYGIAYENDFWEYTPDGFNVGGLSSYSYCVGSLVKIPFLITNQCNSGNIFTAQLSDSSGHFDIPMAIGSITGLASDTITCSIPLATPPGKKYRVRIISSFPADTTEDIGIDISIQNTIPGHPSTINGYNPGCKMHENTYSIDLIPNADKYLWTMTPGILGNGSISNSVIVSFHDSVTTGLLSVSGNNACGFGDTSTISLSSYDCGGSWVLKTPFTGTARTDAVGFSIGQKGYLGTGYDGSRKNDFWEFDPLTNSWTQKANFGGSPRQDAVGFSISGKGYIGTGNDGNNKKDFWEFDPITNIWTQKADFGGLPRYGATGFSISSKGYLGTGYSSSRFMDFWEYDPVTNVWIRKADFGGTSRGGAVGFSISEKGYVGTGHDNDGYYVNDFWEFNPALNTWTRVADFSGHPRRNAVGFSIGNKGYVGTGIANNNEKDFWEFDPNTNSWTRLMDFSGTARTQSVGFSIGTKGFIGTGFAASRVNDFWEYTPSGFNVGILPGTVFCNGSIIEVPFTISPPSALGNYFEAQLSDSTGNFENFQIIGSISGIISDTIIASLPLQNGNGTKYRVRVVSSDPINASTDNLIDLTIYTSTVGGTTSGGTTISLGFPTDTLRIEGSIGSILKWQKQLNNGTYMDISNSSGLSFLVETPEIGEWKYRTLIRNGTCDSIYSIPTHVVVVNGLITRIWTGIVDDNWDNSGNWSPIGKPSNVDDVIIPENTPFLPVVRYNGMACNNVTIKKNAKITVYPGITLIIHGNMTVESE